jgi:hypothetical protein
MYIQAACGPVNSGGRQLRLSRITDFGNLHVCSENHCWLFGNLPVNSGGHNLLLDTQVRKRTHNNSCLIISKLIRLWGRKQYSTWHVCRNFSAFFQNVYFLRLILNEIRPGIHLNLLIKCSLLLCYFNQHLQILVKISQFLLRSAQRFLWCFKREDERSYINRHCAVLWTRLKCLSL